MRLLLSDDQGTTIRLTTEELGILASSLNEHCRMLGGEDFERQLGVTKADARALVEALVQAMEKVGSLHAATYRAPPLKSPLIAIATLPRPDA